MSRISPLSTVGRPACRPELGANPIAERWRFSVAHIGHLLRQCLVTNHTRPSPDGH
jgi:hypothetical protein